MTVREVRLYGDPVLNTRADEVTEFGPALERLAQDMLETMDHYGGVGLAANQIGITRRIFVFDCDGDRGHVINPTWEAVGEETETGGEGCLSIPDVHGDVTRALRVRLRGTTVDGEEVDREVTDLMARCVQHETDHLDGVLFIEHLSTEQRREAMRQIRESEWFKQ